MRIAFFTVCMLGVFGLLSLVTGCATEKPGVTDTAGTYSTMFDSTPDKVTAAAKEAVTDLKLTDVNSVATKVDGKVTARTAQNDTVTINIEKAGQNVSKLSIRIGALGDESLSQQIIAKIRSNLD